MYRTVAIVQARMGSNRLPGKSLKPVWRDMSLLEMVLRRVQQGKTLHLVILATSNQAQDDALTEVADLCGTPFFRGDEMDVLGRFNATLDSFPADAIVRICADNPLIDAIEVDKLVKFFWDEQPCDYASNNQADWGLPDGIGAEIHSAEVLRRLAQTPMSLTCREHVTLWLREHSGQFNCRSLKTDIHLCRPNYRLDVDYPSDLNFIRGMTI